MFDIWHVAMPVANLQKSVSFYTEGLGFELVGYHQEGDRHQAFVKIKSKPFTIELFEAHTEKCADFFRPHHFAFECNDLDAFHKSLASKDYFKELSSPGKFDNGVKYMSIKDPDGVAIEFFQGRKIFDASIGGIRCGEARKDFSIDRVSDFVQQHLKPGDTILDVGAGRGHISANLASRGFNVTAIDRSQKSVDLAKANGVSVVNASIESFTSQHTFDAVLLSMVAHHIHPLEQALDKTRDFLKQGGRIIIEDFAVEDIDEQAATWYYQTLAFAKSAGLLNAQDNDLLVAVEDPLKTWWQEHSDEHHPFNTGTQILDLMRKRFEILSVERVPYFYRYIASACTENSPAGNFGEALFNLENQLILKGKLKALGLRIVAVKA